MTRFVKCTFDSKLRGQRVLLTRMMLGVKCLFPRLRNDRVPWTDLSLSIIHLLDPEVGTIRQFMFLPEVYYKEYFPFFLFLPVHAGTKDRHIHESFDGWQTDGSPKWESTSPGCLCMILNRKGSVQQSETLTPLRPNKRNLESLYDTGREWPKGHWPFLTTLL